MKNTILFFLLLSISSCSSKEKLNLSTPEKITLPKPSDERPIDAQPVAFKVHSEDKNLNDILNLLSKNINQTSYQMSDVFSHSSLNTKNRSVFFYSASEEIDKNENLIHLELNNNPSYGAYQFSIHYDKKEKKRTWLFSLDLEEDQLEKQLRKTLLRFAFQSL